MTQRGVAILAPPPQSNPIQSRPDSFFFLVINNNNSPNHLVFEKNLEFLSRKNHHSSPSLALSPLAFNPSSLLPPLGRASLLLLHSYPLPTPP